MEISKRIVGIDFSIFNEKTLKNYSAFGVSGITRPDIYENQEPRKDGLIDSRMGTTNDEILCDTCQLNSKYCIGHFGHINLGYPVFHVGFLPYIKDILNCICIRCSNLRIDKTNGEILKIVRLKQGKARLNAIKELVKDMKYCSRGNINCNSPLPKIKEESKKTTFRLEFIAEFAGLDTTHSGQKTSEKLKYKLTTAYIYNIFKAISDEDCIILGLNPNYGRPEDMIHTIFPVPPVAIRPSIKIESASFTNEDDLTKKLVSIVKHNRIILSNKDNPSIENNINLLQYHIATYYNNDNQLMLKSEQKNKDLKSIVTRLKGKEGRFRNNLMGKRNNYTARTVITPDASIKVNEVGIPIYIAKNLTFQETVTQNNIDQMNIYLKNGPFVHPGANIYIPVNEDGTYTKQIDLRIARYDIELKVGDKLERHLINGDIVLFNRQPSLHKYSMMGHYIKIVDNPNYTSFRLNVGITTPYNADYDGDEMNITIPRTIQSQIELKELVDVKKHFINCQTSKPLVGCKMDAIIGIYLMTHKNLKLPGKVVMNILSYMEIPIDKQDFIVNINNTYSGKELFSYIIPKKINISNKDFIIENGIMKSGVINVTYLGDKQNQSLIRVILDLYNDEEARKFFDNVQKMTNIFNMWYGFTTSFKDIEYSQDITDKIKTLIDNVILKVGVHTTEMENDPSLESPELYEEFVKGDLTNIRSTVGKLIVDNFKDDNNIKIIIDSGSSGKVGYDSISKNVAMEAQHDSMGGRPKKMEGRRTLPYYCRDLDMPTSRGFVGHGFIQGLTFQEFIFNSITAREGLINIQIKTADSGYIQRKLIKIMEDFHIAYDGLVKNINGGIIQFAYGDSNIDTSKQYDCKINILIEDDKQIRAKYIFNDTELKMIKNYSSDTNEQFYEYLISERDKLRELQIKTRTTYTNFNMFTNFSLPINITKIKSMMLSHDNQKIDTNLQPEYINNRIRDMFNHDNMPLLCINKKYINEESFKLKDENIFKSTLKLLIYELLCPKRCIFEYKISKEIFDIIIDDLTINVKRNLINPGEMIGVLAAQSICENITQTNLRSHHLTGVSSKTAANSGTSRIVEIFSNIKDIKTPISIIRFNEERRQNKKYVEQVSSYLRQTVLRDIYNSINVYYDPTNEHKFDNTTNIFNVSNKDDKYTNSFYSLPWLVKIILQKDEMLFKNITLLDIVIQIYNMWMHDNTSIKKKHNKYKAIFDCITQISIASNDDNDIENIIHIRFKMIDYNLNILDYFVMVLLEYVRIKGIEGIKESELNKSLYTSFDNPTHKLDNTNEEYIIRTAGINLIDIRSVKGIDLNKTSCNDINVIYNTFGIEAARSILIDELMELTQSKVNYNHLSILVDYMTREGYILSVDRNGLEHSDASLLGRLTFEKPIDKILSASLFNEHDNNNGVSARIMTGRMIKGGTGFCDLMFNSDMVMNSEYTDYDEYTAKEYLSKDNSTLVNDIFDTNDEDIFIPD